MPRNPLAALLKTSPEPPPPQAEGVRYRPVVGAVCPKCGRSRATVTRTLPLEGGVVQRYHKCWPGCGTNFKSVEEVEA